MWVYVGVLMCIYIQIYYVNKYISIMIICVQGNKRCLSQHTQFKEWTTISYRNGWNCTDHSTSWTVTNPNGIGAF